MIYTVGFPVVISCDIITNIWIHSLKTGVIEVKENMRVSENKHNRAEQIRH